MKKTVLFCLFVCSLFSNSIFSQSDDFSKNQIKFYLNTINEGYEENKTNDVFFKNISKIGVPSIAYTWKKSEKTWQEIEVSTFFERNQDVSVIGSTVSSSFNETLGYFSVRYERNRILLGSDKVDLSLGGSFQAFYLRNSFIPSTSSGFPFSYNGLHTKTTLVPRALIKFNRFALDFNMPFSVIHLNYRSFREDNPLLARFEETQTGINYLLFPNSYFLQARIGLAFNLK